MRLKAAGPLLLLALGLLGFLGYRLFERAVPPSASASPPAQPETAEVFPGDSGSPSFEPGLQVAGQDVAERSLDELAGRSQTLQDARRLARLGRAIFAGRVLDESGVAVPDAAVFYAGRSRALAGPRGEYRISVELVPGRWVGHRPSFPVLLAHVAGKGTSRPLSPPRGGRFDLILQSGLELNGTVIESSTGRPVADAKVRAVVTTGRAQPSWETTVVTASDGSFRLLGLPASSRVHLVAQASGHQPGIWQTFQIGGPVDGVELELGVGAEIFGHFEPWPPLADAPTELRVSLPALGEERYPVAKDGSFQFPVPATGRRVANLELWIGASHVWSREVDPRKLEGGQLGAQELPMNVRVRGRLKTQGLEGLEVMLEGEGEAVASVVADGSFELFPVAPGFYSWSLRHGANRSSPLGRMVITEEPEVDLGEWTISDPLIVGCVLDADGREVARASAELHVEPAGGGRRRLVASQDVDSKGRFVLLVGPLGSTQPCCLSVRAPGYLRWESRLSLTSEVQRIEVLVEEGRSFTGTLRDPAQQPLEGWWVSAVREGNTFEVKSDFTAADGSFEIAGLADEEYELKAESPDGERTVALEVARPAAGGRVFTVGG